MRLIKVEGDRPSAARVLVPLPRVGERALVEHPQYGLVLPTWWWWTEDPRRLLFGLCLAAPFAVPLGLLTPWFLGYGLVRAAAFMVVSLGFGLGLVERGIRFCAWLRRRKEDATGA